MTLPKDKVARLKELRKRELLPHLWGWNWYPWAKKFYQSKNKFNFLCAANQISKSSTQIRKCINWATDKSLWPELWPHNPRPTQFLYLYPIKSVATTEFYEKWVPEFLPKGEMKKDLVYGWEEEIKNKEIWAIHFNSGVSVYFKTYAQDVQDLQTSTAYAIFTDEELPFPLFNELRSRLIATNGYFHQVFTATLGQDEWRRTMEPANESEEMFKGALKLQVSMYDCLYYEDGTKSFWTVDRIKEIEMACTSEAEVQKRVHGKFVLTSGLKCAGFSRSRNLIPRRAIPTTWSIYTGTDIGGGGEGHPAAIACIAVRPDFKFGIIFKGWRGDGVVTSSSDILQKHNELLIEEQPTQSGEMKRVQIMPVLKSYDHSAKDFFIIASRADSGFTPADKRRDAGTSIMNTLFKLGMLVVFDDDPELQKLVVELTSLQETTSKQHAKDDFYDAVRYGIMPIPWDFEGVAGEIIKEEEKYVDTRTKAQEHFDERRPGQIPVDEDTYDLDKEFEEWNGYLLND